MRIFDEPEDVIRMLQGPPTETELAGEQAAIDQMVAAQARPVVPLKRRRPYRLGALVAAGVIGFGGVAAAGPGGFDPLQLGPTPDVEDDTVIVEDAPIVEDQSVVEADVDEPENESESPDGEESEDQEGEEDSEDVPAVVAEVEESDTPLFVDDPYTDFDETRCKPGPHGATVSAVARGDEGFEDLDVVEAAHSLCGKKTLQLADEDPQSESVEGSEDSEEHLEPAEASSDDEQESEESGGQHPGKAKSSNGQHGNQGKGKGKGGRD